LRDITTKLLAGEPLERGQTLHVLYMLRAHDASDGMQRHIYQ
jgi:hypothetical protein